jgi:uncharacterized protein YidB (DUF937 family)
MGLLDSVIGAIAANSGSQAGAGADPLQAILGLLNQSGGLPGLLQKLQQAGLGDAVNSWVSTGANQPVSADALGDALGGHTVAGFAQQLGMDPQQGLGVLAQLLPQVVDGLSPQGQLPAGGADLGSLLGGLLGGGQAGGPGGAQGGMGDLAGMLGGLLGKR